VTADDPVRARRARFDRASRMGQRIGYSLYLVAVIAFFVGFATDFSTLIIVLVVGGLGVGSAFLLPAIIFGYAVKAAEREDRERGD
jgi:hypothetical protein